MADDDFKDDIRALREHFVGSPETYSGPPRRPATWSAFFWMAGVAAVLLIIGFSCMSAQRATMPDQNPMLVIPGLAGCLFGTLMAMRALVELFGAVFVRR